jgi:hypothetical protein
LGFWRSSPRSLPASILIALRQTASFANAEEAIAPSSGRRSSGRAGTSRILVVAGCLREARKTPARELTGLAAVLARLAAPQDKPELADNRHVRLGTTNTALGGGVMPRSPLP